MTKRPGNDFGGRFSRKSANAPIDEVSPIKRSNNRLQTHGSISKSEMFVSVEQKNTRTKFQITAPNEFVKMVREPTTWTQIYKDQICKVVCTTATKDSDFVSLGQLIFELIFYNGQRIRIEKGMLTERRVRAINRSIIKALATNEMSAKRPTN